MARQGLKSSESRFAAYVEGLVSVIGHEDRAQPLRDYCAGLILPCERKSVEPIAAVTAPARVAAQITPLLLFSGGGGVRVGVAGQYCGHLGKQNNYQVAVSLRVANEHASLPVTYRLYLPQEWT